MCELVKSLSLFPGLDYESLLEGGNWTVFAFTDIAFTSLNNTRNLPELDDVDFWKNIVDFHIAVGEFQMADLQCKKTIEMANGKDSRTLCKYGPDKEQRG